MFFPLGSFCRKSTDTSKLLQDGGGERDVITDQDKVDVEIEEDWQQEQK